MNARAGVGGVRVEPVRETALPTFRIGLVHGLEEGTEVWQPVVSLLRENVEAWSFVLPWGGSAGQSWAMEREPSVWLDQVFAVAPPGIDVLVAHSFGANVLLDYLHTRRTVRPRALVLISPFFRPRFESFDWPAISYYLNDFHRILEEGIVVRRRKHPDPAVVTAMAEKVRDRVGPYGWLRFFELFSRTPALPMATYDMPCLVIGGERDRGAFADDCRALARALPRASVEILAGCGHFTMLEQPDAVAALIDRFLAGLVSESGDAPLSVPAEMKG